MGKNKEYEEGDKLAQEFEDNTEEWSSASEEEQEAMRKRLSAKEKRISLRMSADILQKLRTKAAREGLPYQTYINSVLFKVANQDDTSVKELARRLIELEAEVKRLKAG